MYTHGSIGISRIEPIVLGAFSSPASLLREIETIPRFGSMSFQRHAPRLVGRAVS